jgi:glycosyltransferase involved in cell wall biosynthesis
MAKLKVLVCPAHYLVDDKLHGSEYAWPLGLMRACSTLCSVEITAVAGAVGPGVSVPGVRIVALGTKLSDRETITGLARFVLSYTKAAIAVTRTWRPDVVHHLLPFRIGATFNPLILAGRGARTVVGPVQPSHTVALDDEAGVSRGDYASSANRPGRTTGGASWRLVQGLASRLSALTLRRAGTVLAVNRAGADAVMQLSGVAANLVPFGVDADRFVPGPRESVNRRRVVFLVVAYLVARKRVADVIRAIAMVASHRSDVRLRIVGDGPERIALMALAQSLRLGDTCEFVGHVPHDRIVVEYQRADVLVSMSASESYGMSLLEAMACGLPVLSAENDGAIGIVEHGVTGYLVAKADIQQLAKRMNELFSDHERACSLGRAAQECVQTQYSWNVIASRMVGAYGAIA